jgi:AcrR family transcriptional regulator
VEDVPVRPPRGAPQEAAPGHQRERIRLAAVQLFTRQGFAGTSMKQLAKSLEMAPGNLYNYFDNKESILFDVLEHQLLGVISRNRTILAEQSGPLERLHRLAWDLVINDLNDPLAAFVGIQGVRGLSNTNLEYVSGLMAQIRASWVAVIAEGVAAGDFKVRDAKLCALSALTLCSSISTWFQPDGGYSAEYVADEVADMVLRMAGAER